MTGKKPADHVTLYVPVSMNTFKKLQSVAEIACKPPAVIAKRILERAFITGDMVIQPLPPTILSDHALQRSMKVFTVAPYGDTKFRYAISNRPADHGRVVLTELSWGKWERCPYHVVQDVRQMIERGLAVYVEKKDGRLD